MSEDGYEGLPQTLTNVEAPAGDASTGRVLREVELGSQPLLLRPRMRGPGTAAKADRGQGASRPEPGPHDLAESQAFHAALAAAREEGLSRGLEEGRAQASAELEAARGALQSAFDEQVTKIRQDVDAQARERIEALDREMRGTLAERLQLLDRAVASLETEAARQRGAVEEDALALCHEAVCRVLGREGLKPATLANHLHAVLAPMMHEEAPSVLLHPDDFAVLEGMLRAFEEQVPAASLDRLRQVQWLASPEVVLGGCIVRSRTGGLDARWETQLHELRETLLRERDARRARPSEALS